MQSRALCRLALRREEIGYAAYRTNNRIAKLLGNAIGTMCKIGSCLLLLIGRGEHWRTIAPCAIVCVPRDVCGGEVATHKLGHGQHNLLDIHDIHCLPVTGFPGRRRRKTKHRQHTQARCRDKQKRLTTAMPWQSRCRCTLLVLILTCAFSASLFVFIKLHELFTRCVKLSQRHLSRDM